MRKIESDKERKKCKEIVRKNVEVREMRKRESCLCSRHWHWMWWKKRSHVNAKDIINISAQKVKRKLMKEDKVVRYEQHQGDNGPYSSLHDDITIARTSRR